jgi:hypothetical protein
MMNYSSKEYGKENTPPNCRVLLFTSKKCSFLKIIYKGVSKSFQTELITK